MMHGTEQKIRIAYIVNARMPTEKAHGYQIAKMCEEWSRAGAEVKLYVPDRRNPIKRAVFDYYGLENNFDVEYVRCFDAVRFAKLFGRAAFVLQTRLFIRALRDVDIGRDVVIYSRDADIVGHFARLGFKTVYDAHNFPRHPDRLIRSVGGSMVVANSAGTAREFSSRGFERVLAAQNGVDIGEFDIPGDKDAFRSELGLPLDAKIAAYVGHLYAWKGVDTVLAAAPIAPETMFLIVGGTDADIEAYRKKVSSNNLDNVVIFGRRPRKDIPKILKASDALLLPNAPSSAESERYTSPLKMFEYMASGRPIVVSDLSSMREVLSDETARFFRAGDPTALARAVREALVDREGSAERASLARVLAERYSWSARAKAILEFIGR